MAIYAFDGTKNEQKEDLVDCTNVIRFLEHYQPEELNACLLCLSEREEYLAGVGTRMHGIGSVLGGFAGAGGRTRIREFTEMFIQNWRNGDHVVDVIGYSRGAALALHFCNKLSDGVEIDGVKVVPTIRFLGLWDTVPSFGLPGIFIDIFNDINLGWRLNVPGNVKKCVHAMALDEGRQAFQVHRPSCKKPDRTQLIESWFRGVHSDVGGGSGNTGLSSITLHWILEHAKNSGCDVANLESLETEFDQEKTPEKNKFSGEWERREILDGDRIHETSARKLKVGDEEVVTVVAKVKNNLPPILVEPGEEYLISFPDDAKWEDDWIDCGPEGWPEDQPDDIPGPVDGLYWALLNSKVAAMSKRVRAARWFELVVTVEYDEEGALPAGQGQFKESPWKPTRYGRISFFANDADRKYEKNDGAIDVTIQRVK